MEVIFENRGVLKIEKPTGIGLGNFDGLHIGHMTLVNMLIGESKLNGLDSILYTFTSHPENIIRKDLVTPLLTTPEKKADILSETTLKYLYFSEFNEEFSRMEPEAFVKTILVDRLKMKLAVAGFDYRFGYKGEGDISLLKKLGRKYNFRVVMVHPIRVDNDIISSTLIRHHISKGSMGVVFKLLGRHYSVSGNVVKGRRIGNTIGFPTANVQAEDYILVPGHGVYATRTLIDGILYKSVTSIGKNPTFEELNKASIETYILDFEQDIYDKNIEVFFISKLRDEKKFGSVDELVQNIKQDVEAARRFLDFS